MYLLSVKSGAKIGIIQDNTIRIPSSFSAKNEIGVFLKFQDTAGETTKCSDTDGRATLPPV